MVLHLVVPRWDSRLFRAARKTRDACLCISNIPHYKILRLMAKLLGHVNLIGRSEFCLSSTSCQKNLEVAREEKNSHDWLTLANFRTTVGPLARFKSFFSALFLSQEQHDGPRLHMYHQVNSSSQSHWHLFADRSQTYWHRRLAD